MRPVRVLIVDDSATMCGLIKRALRGDPGIEVVGSAHDPYEARTAIKELSPDVVTLDVEMPRMNGLEFLDKIMRLRPMPVIMVSSMTAKGGAIAIEALTRGAFECVGKPSGSDLATAFATLPAIVKAAGASSIKKMPSQERAETESEGPLFTPNQNIVVIGASTGGVDAIGAILSRFPANCPPTLITQHMPPGFTASFANRLDQNFAPTVTEASDGMILQPGHVYLAPGGIRHLELASRKTCILREGPEISGHRPSVDALFHSAANLKRRVVGVILTGMGKDGAAGLAAIRAAGGHSIGQDEASSIVYGMPRIAFEMGGVEQQLPLKRIGTAILGLCNATAPVPA